MRMMDLLLLVLASFRLTHLIVLDSITEPLRRPVAALPVLGTLVTCYWCCGVWVSALLVAAYHWYPAAATPIVWLLAVAGGQALLERLTERP